VAGAGGCQKFKTKKKKKQIYMENAWALRMVNKTPTRDTKKQQKTPGKNGGPKTEMRQLILKTSKKRGAWFEKAQVPGAGGPGKGGSCKLQVTRTGLKGGSRETIRHPLVEFVKATGFGVCSGTGCQRKSGVNALGHRGTKKVLVSNRGFQYGSAGTKKTTCKGGLRGLHSKNAPYKKVGAHT